jgi:hypothetical protein
MSLNSADSSHLTKPSHVENGSQQSSNSEEGLTVPQKEPNSLRRSLLSSEKNVNGMETDTGYLAIAFSIVLFPLVVISILLLLLLFHYRILHNQIVSPEFQAAVEVDEPGVYYTTISSTSFVLLASYSSTFAHVMIAFFMSLLSYPISQRFLKHSKTRSVQRLPTPYQFALLIGCLNGNVMSLWRWLRHSWRRIRRNAIDTLGSVVVIFLMVNILTYALHVLLSLTQVC